METGYKQQIQCDGDQSEHQIWCDMSPAVEERNFWTFQAMTFTIGLISYAIVYLRQQKLDKELMDKIHKQIGV